MASSSLDGIIPGVSLALLPAPLHHGLLVLLFDLVSLLALVGVIIAVSRRLFFAPDYLETAYVKARSLEAFLILGFIALLMLAYFGLHGAEIALGRRPAAALHAGFSTLSPACCWPHSAAQP